MLIIIVSFSWSAVYCSVTFRRSVKLNLERVAFTIGLGPGVQYLTGIILLLVRESVDFHV